MESVPTNPSLSPTAEMYTLYCSLFRPYLSYCNEIWGNTYPSNVECLVTLQKQATRLICNAGRLAHTNAMLKDMSILKLSEFLKIQNCHFDVQLIPCYLTYSIVKEDTKYSSVHSTCQNK